MNLTRKIQEQKIIYRDVLRKEAALFLGVAAPNITNDCQLIGMQRPGRNKGMSLDELYRLWCLRVLMMVTDCDRRELAKRVHVTVSIKQLERYMTGLGHSVQRFAEAYKYWQETGECIKPGGYNRQLPEAFRRSLSKKRWQYGHYIRRDVVANYLGVSGGSVSTYLRVLGYCKGHHITKEIFKQIVKLRLTAVEWQQEFKRHAPDRRQALRKTRQQTKGTVTTEYFQFLQRFTFKIGKALNNAYYAEKLNIEPERKRLEAKLAETLQGLDVVFQQLVKGAVA